MYDYPYFQNIDKLLKAYFSLSFKLGYVLHELSSEVKLGQDANPALPHGRPLH